MKRYWIWPVAFILLGVQSGVVNAIPYTDNGIKLRYSEEETVNPATTLETKLKSKSAIQKVKVIGNRNTKKYHLPGMKYYNAVEVSHRVVFDSEEDAIKAGYRKAPK